jgi:hypothetical protein
MVPCDKCDMAEWCAEIGRCFRKGIDTSEDEGEVTDMDELNEIELKKEKLTAPRRIDQQDRDFLKNILNF